MKNLTPEPKAELFPDNLLMMGYRGSIAHNMYVPNTDIRCGLPNEPEYDKINSLVMDIIFDYTNSHYLTAGIRKERPW